MDTGLIIIISILATLLTFAFIRLINTIQNYFLNRNKEKVWYWNEHVTNSDIKLEDSLIVSSNFLKFINGLIDIQIIEHTETLDLLHQPYNIIRLDEDVTKMATSVFQAIKKEIYTNPYLCLTEEYLMTYITTQASLRFTHQMKERNAQLYMEEINK